MNVENWFGGTPIGDDDWVRPGFLTAVAAEDQPALTESIYHSGSVGMGDFSSTAVQYPLHIKRGDRGGNTTIKLESYSASILHLAADVAGTGPASRSAHYKLQLVNLQPFEMQVMVEFS